MCMQWPSDPVPSTLLPFTLFTPTAASFSDFCLWTLPASRSSSLPLFFWEEPGYLRFPSSLSTVTNFNSFFKVPSSLRTPINASDHLCNNTLGYCSKIESSKRLFKDFCPKTLLVTKEFIIELRVLPWDWQFPPWHTWFHKISTIEAIWLTIATYTHNG